MPIADLVGEVHFTGSLVNEGFLQFHADERPSTRTEKSPTLSLRGGRGNSSSGVVGQTRDYGHILQAELLRKLTSQGSQRGTRRNDLGQLFLA